VRALWLEFVVCYGVLPTVFAVLARRYGYRGAMAPVLWLVSAAIGFVLYRDASFDRALLWRFSFEHPHVRVMLLCFVLLGAGILLLGRLLSRERFLGFPRTRPALWLVFMVAYPMLSALPQGIIWRVFLVHRYRVLFPDLGYLIAVGAAAFSLAHLAFWNVIALAVTALGGALFLWTYLATESMWLAVLEHGAYGLAAFAAGLGPYLYRGSSAPRRAFSSEHS
jgi:uncharacterized protein